ncbi:MAG: hypothetical protein NVS2B17_15540 [Candidatus Velthaea sp.]
MITGDAMVRALKRAGFDVIRTRGPHKFLAHKDGRTTTVPSHGNATLKPGTLRGLLRRSNDRRQFGANTGGL